MSWYYGTCNNLDIWLECQEIWYDDQGQVITDDCSEKFYEKSSWDSQVANSDLWAIVIQKEDVEWGVYDDSLIHGVYNFFSEKHNPVCEVRENIYNCAVIGLDRDCIH